MSGRRRALVPAPADDPLALRNRGGARRHAVHGFGFSLDADQIHAIERRAQIRQVHMRFDEAGHDRRAAKVDDASAGAAVPFGLNARADKGNPVAGDGDGFGVWLPAVGAAGRARRGPALAIRIGPRQRVDVGADEQDVSRRRARAGHQTARDKQDSEQNTLHEGIVGRTGSKVACYSLLPGDNYRAHQGEHCP
jgi:hypothetical protein